MSRFHLVEYMSQLKIDIQKTVTASPQSGSAKDQTSIWNRDISLGNPFGLKQKKAFYELLTVLLVAGLGIIDALEVVADQQQKGKGKVNDIIHRLIQSLKDGESFSASMTQQAQFFDSFEQNSIRMGEKSGTLNAVLEELAHYYESRLKIRRKLMQVMSYPIVVISMASLVVYFMITQVVPMFQDVFKQFDAELPALTQRILDLSEFIQAYGLYIMGFLLVLSLGAYRVRNREWFRKYSSMLVLRIPVFGSIIFKVQLSRFALTMGTLLTSRVKLDEALELAERIAKFYPIQSQLPGIRQGIINGETLYAAIRDIPIFPVVLKQMVRVGEKTARLDHMFERLGKSLEQESEIEISNLTHIVEPLLVMILGLIVGTILVAMYLPMFQLTQAISI